MSNWKHGLPLSERWHLFQTVPSKQSWFTVSTESKVVFFFSLWFMFLFSVSAAPLWPSQLVDHTGFSKQDLVSLCVLLYVKWWVFQCFLGLFYSIIINKLPVTQMTSPLRLKQNTCSLFQKWSSLYFCYIQSVYVCETEGKKMAVHWGLCCAQKSAGMKFHQQHVVSQCHYWITYWVTVMLFTVTHFD